MATVPPQELEETLGLLADARTTNELAVTALTVVVLDHIMTFPDEVRRELDLDIALEHRQDSLYLGSVLITPPSCHPIHYYL
ncbi:hypothetical protein B0H14DRAFT_3483370 [Mycena olivaceomarginata]|nr:hypothetical protein B0H14DRAFT_3483370 [Mycena olivaceomarginata]